MSDKMKVVVHDTIPYKAVGAVEVHGLRTRPAGKAIFIEFHRIVLGDLTITAAQAA